MNKKINELIPMAIKAIENSNIAVNGIVEKEYNGYIASMGASITHSRLLPTIAFYSNESGSKDKRLNLMRAILLLLDDSAGTDDKLLKYIITNSKLNPDQNTNPITLNSLDPNKLALFEKRITDVIIALKLALRTFKEKEKEI